MESTKEEREKKLDNRHLSLDKIEKKNTNREREENEKAILLYVLCLFSRIARAPRTAKSENVEK